MSWAARRRLIILLIVGAVIVAFLVIISIATFYQAPSCTDGVQNQGEQGIDCGGPCAFLCSAQVQPPTVLFTKALPNGAGRTDVVASIENKNPNAAAKAVPYRLMLYGADHALIKEVDGTFDLPPSATMPVFVPNIMSGKQTGTTAFLSIDPASVHWFTEAKDPRLVPAIAGTTLVGTVDAPRIEAALSNPDVQIMSNVPVIVIVRDASGNVIAASQTVVAAIPGQGQSTATFTWNTAFLSVPTSIEVVPVIMLP